MKDQYITTKDYKLRYVQAGDHGEPVILIPGLGASLEIWSENILPLAKHHRVYALDPVGYAKSDKPKMEYSLENIAQSIHDFMKALNIPKAHLIGSSLGGALSLKFAKMYPESIDRLVLVGSAGFGRKLPLAFRLATLPIIGPLLVRPTRMIIKKSMEAITVNTKAITDAVVDSCTSIAKIFGQRKTTLKILRHNANFSGIKKKVYEKEIVGHDRMQAKTLLVWGKQDPVIRPEDGELAKEMLPDAKLVYFDQCGHLPHLEYPEKFNQLVCEFLA